MNFWLDVLPPVIGAVLLWWGATGTIIYLCGRKAWRPWVFGFVTVLQPLAFWRLWAEKNSAEVGGVFMSFFWAIIIWSWIETSYYTGFVVGRRTPELEPDTPTGRRFRQAIIANLYHELAILALSGAVIVTGWGGVNETGLWAFMILHWTHQSAKINIFLGVNNLTTEYLPDNLKYMAQYFTQRPLNTFFPFSATITTVIATFLFSSILSSNNAGQQVGQALLFVMMAAAILEHWWLVTPVPTGIWKWALKSREKGNSPPALDQKSKNSAFSYQPSAISLQLSAFSYQPSGLPSQHSALAPRGSQTGSTQHSASLPAVFVVCGYLGSGKTTLIRHVLPQLDGRVAVIVNDFGAVGIDAELIRAQGAAGAVLELPGGCVCCTLQKNLTGQIIKLLEDYRPDRILIEPSGVAGIEEIVRALASPRLLGRLGPVEVVAVVDAPRLLTPAGLQKFTLTQIKAASAVVVSKTDLILPGELSETLSLVSSLNPLARLFPAKEGQVSAAQLLNLPSEAAELPEHEHEEARAIHSEENGLISFAREYDGLFDPSALKILYDELANGYFGPVERAKGLFITPERVVQAWDLAGGRVFCRVLPAPATPAQALLTTRFMLVARDLAADELHRRLQNCLIRPLSERF
jgi:putative photosynthetic complex assembly protein 2